MTALKLITSGDKHSLHKLLHSNYHQRVPRSGLLPMPCSKSSSSFLPVAWPPAFSWATAAPSLQPAYLPSSKKYQSDLTNLAIQHIICPHCSHAEMTALKLITSGDKHSLRKLLHSNSHQRVPRSNSNSHQLVQKEVKEPTKSNVKPSSSSLSAASSSMRRVPRAEEPLSMLLITPLSMLLITRERSRGGTCAGRFCCRAGQPGPVIRCTPLRAGLPSDGCPGEAGEDACGLTETSCKSSCGIAETSCRSSCGLAMISFFVISI